MSYYSVSQSGWIPRIISDLKEGKECGIALSGNDAVLVIGRISHLMDRLPFKDFPSIPKVTISSADGGNISIDPKALPLLLSSIGALGAAAASAAYVLSIAHAAGFRISVGYDIKDPYTVLDDQLQFKIWRA